MHFIKKWVGIAALVCSSGAMAQNYPNKPITLVIPFAAGSGTDFVARTVAQKLSERLKQPVVVDNKAGASAQIAAQFVAKAAPDGYTLFMTTNTSHSANPWMFKTLNYDPIKDFTPIVRVGELPFALAINPKIPAKTLQEFIDYAKKTPGKLAYATPNSTSLVAMETIKNIAGLDIVGVPYKASPQAMTDLISGEVQVYVVDLGSGMASLKSDRVRLLAVTTAKGSQSFPGTPAIASVVKGFDLVSWNGIFGPANLPRPIVDKINTEMQAVFADKDFQAKIAATGFELDPTKTPEEFAKYVDFQLKHWGEMLRNAGVKPQ
ncbi:tripartite tricarboxylate transporter substrate binding protein [Alcaligenaceae bacterium LF4-65]|jgi:tripartite-type tricarboxylate transporter receptor subunit TctC|uniref:Tripartite tricarboxylate transporter substrate binding protein n=1 Tax=Zwartia hollandica TaxID=324606 RepID=A0A953N8G9_9BURK|nr:tripartite tricarboxylate transporter substrate binding protein [Zwartia hollandica]MBZ1349572.1 tripartite tricarboxylate transporter substrate binding protein [Zwartia hollandica]